jgi:hypothetical protein
VLQLSPSRQGTATVVGVFPNVNYPYSKIMLPPTSFTVMYFDMIIHFENKSHFKILQFLNQNSEPYGEFQARKSLLIGIIFAMKKHLC